jgi:hypothetical protein
VRRDQLEHAIRTACQITGRPEVIGTDERVRVKHPGDVARKDRIHEARLPFGATVVRDIPQLDPVTSVGR